MKEYIYPAGFPFGVLLPWIRQRLYDHGRDFTFSHRTDTKPRPEVYREMGWGRYERKSVWIKNPLLSPVEALGPSETGKVPPEPSKGHGEPQGVVETASLNQP